ncbi:MAG: PepSY domain-containing protein [Chitinophagaceae bacterium]|jgi:uncharacterized iron-regulated membrane protein|nr:PepSY domain-containing protein [Chitinophagaceae bacterium]
MQSKKNKTVIYTRWYRKWHRIIGITGLAVFFIMSVTGLLLIWKKNSGGYLLGETRHGKATIASEWVKIDSLQHAAINFLVLKKPEADREIDRIDIRPEKGVAKISFKNHYTAIQVDLTTGQALTIETRRADFIEQLHDGSLFDKIADTNFLKLLYGTIAGLFLLFLSFSGFFLWFNPKKLKKIKFNKQGTGTQ